LKASFEIQYFQYRVGTLHWTRFSGLAQSTLLLSIRNTD